MSERVDTPPSISRAREREALKLRLVGAAPWLLIVAIVATAGIAYLASADIRNSVTEAITILSSGDQERIREYLRSYGAWGPIVSLSLMTLQAILAPIPASVVQLANGVVFGIPAGTVLNVIGQLSGATVAFFISRSLGQAVAERLVGKIDEKGIVEHWIDRWGSRALFVIRAIPGMPSDFVSYLLGLSTMPARRYIIVSFLGYIPQSLFYAWLGDSAADLFWWVIIGGFAVSGVLGLIVWILQRRRAREQK